MCSQGKSPAMHHSGSIEGSLIGTGWFNAKTVPFHRHQGTDECAMAQIQ
jgi:hypothetical protein